MTSSVSKIINIFGGGISKASIRQKAQQKAPQNLSDVYIQQKAKLKHFEQIITPRIPIPNVEAQQLLSSPASDIDVPPPSKQPHLAPKLHNKLVYVPVLRVYAPLTPLQETDHAVYSDHTTNCNTKIDADGPSANMLFNNNDSDDSDDSDSDSDTFDYNYCAEDLCLIGKIDSNAKIVQSADELHKFSTKRANDIAMDLADLLCDDEDVDDDNVVSLERLLNAFKITQQQIANLQTFTKMSLSANASTIIDFDPIILLKVVGGATVKEMIQFRKLIFAVVQHVNDDGWMGEEMEKWRGINKNCVFYSRFIGYNTTPSLVPQYNTVRGEKITLKGGASYCTKKMYSTAHGQNSVHINIDKFAGNMRINAIIANKYEQKIINIDDCGNIYIDDTYYKTLFPHKCAFIDSNSTIKIRFKTKKSTRNCYIAIEHWRNNTLNSSRKMKIKFAKKARKMSAKCVVAQINGWGCYEIGIF